MNNLIIIGNGFDLAHNFKTSYKDFINHIIQSQIDDISKFNDLLNIKGLNIRNLESFYSSINSTLVRRKVKYNNKFFELLVNDIALKNWCDIEEKYFSQLMSNKNSIDAFHKEFEAIRMYLIEYLKKIDTKTKALKSYSHIFSRLDKENFQIVNFNYTNTLNNYVNDFSPDFRLEKSNIINLHGEIDQNNNPIIFGYASKDKDSLDLMNRGNKEHFRYIKKHLYKRTENENKLKEYLNNNKDIQLFLLGHSCGMSDELILFEIFTHPNVKNIRVFYHNDYESYFELQYNINKIMGNPNQQNKLVSFELSNRTPQHDDNNKQIKEFESYIYDVIDKYEKDNHTYTFGESNPTVI